MSSQFDVPDVTRTVTLPSGVVVIAPAHEDELHIVSAPYDDRASTLTAHGIDYKVKYTATFLRGEDGSISLRYLSQWYMRRNDSYDRVTDAGRETIREHMEECVKPVLEDNPRWLRLALAVGAHKTLSEKRDNHYEKYKRYKKMARNHRDDWREAKDKLESNKRLIEVLR